MNYNELKQAILDYFQKYPHTGLSYNEIVNTFQLNKAEKHYGRAFLSGLMEEGILSKDRKKYHQAKMPKAKTALPHSQSQIVTRHF